MSFIWDSLTTADLWSSRVITSVCYKCSVEPPPTEHTSSGHWLWRDATALRHLRLWSTWDMCRYMQPDSEWLTAYNRHSNLLIFTRLAYDHCASSCNYFCSVVWVKAVQVVIVNVVPESGKLNRLSVAKMNTADSKGCQKNINESQYRSPYTITMFTPL